MGRVTITVTIDYPENATVAVGTPETVTVPREASAYLPPMEDAPWPSEQSVAPIATERCPVHGTPWKTVPAGVSKKTGKPYTSFQTCSEQGCNERPR